VGVCDVIEIALLILLQRLSSKRWSVLDSVKYISCSLRKMQNSLQNAHTMCVYMLTDIMM